jgi:hypothetical protein
MDREVDPPHLQDDLEIGPPDFIGVGSQKSGTSWWYSLLCRHPLVFHDKAVHKERHFFERYWNRPFNSVDIERYHRWFRRPSGMITGEWTPDYMARAWVSPLLARAAPDARLLIILRDPMKRLESGLNHHLRRETPITPWLISDIINRGRYGEQISHLLDHVDRDRLLVLQYELCVRDTEAQMQRTVEHIGLPNARFDLTTTHQSERVARAPLGRPSPDVLGTAGDLYSADRSVLADLCPHLDFDLWQKAEPWRP